MGFGLLALGYLFLNFYTTGADLIGYIIMLFGLHKLCKVDKKFKKCILPVVVLIPVGLFNLFGFVDTAFELGIMKPEYTKVSYENFPNGEETNSSYITSDVVNDEQQKDSLPETNKNAIKNQTKKGEKVLLAEGIFNTLFIFGSLCFHYFFYKAAYSLSYKTGASKLFKKAKRNMIITILFYSVWGLLPSLSKGYEPILLSLALIHFVILILNFLYIYNCYATFTYESKSDDEDDEE